MKIKWEVDDATVIEATTGGFGKTAVMVNGKEVYKGSGARAKNGLSFTLTDGRSAMLFIKPQFFGLPLIELKVNGQLTTETGKKPFVCCSCGATVKPNDRFCGACGNTMPTAENYANQKRIREATGAISGLAVLFLIAGVVMFFIAKTQADPVLAKLSGMDPQSTVSKPIHGVIYTVAALRHQIVWETWSVLIVNVVLAAIMVGLAIWGKRAPLPAVLIALATYSVVIVTNAIIDPASIAQGLIMKFFIIGFFVKGIKSALSLRAANA